MSFDWLCNNARITYFCSNNGGRGKSGSGDSGVSIRSQAPRATVSSWYVQQIDGAGIGLQWVIDAGSMAAIDVWGADVAGEFCMDGLGALPFLDISTTPRTPSWPDYVQREGQTCATLDRPGMLVLMPPGARYFNCRVITTGNISVRRGPSLEDGIIGYLRRGTTLRVLSRSGDWYSIEYEESTGWVGAAYVTVDCGRMSTPAPNAARAQDCPFVTTGSLRVRTGPSLADDTIGYLRAGVRLRPVSRRGAWIEIDYKGNTGWVGAAYVKADCSGLATPAPRAARTQDCPVVTTGRLRVRAGPSLADDTIGFLRAGVGLRPVSRRGAWIEIDYQGDTGWVGAGFVSQSGDCG